MHAEPGSVTEALRRLHAWKAVRPGSSLLNTDTDALEGAGLVKRVPTLIGVGLTLSRRGRQLIDVPLMTHGEAVVSTALYLQDARPSLSRAGFTKLRPGQGTFHVVTGPGGRPYPLIGRVLKGGYSIKRVRAHLEVLEPDLLASGVKLVVVHPGMDLFQHPRLVVIAHPPAWPAPFP